MPKNNFLPEKFLLRIKKKPHEYMWYRIMFHDFLDRENYIYNFQLSSWNVQP